MARDVPEVESQPCPSLSILTAALGPQLHELENDKRGNTYCVWCKRSWAELDGELRERLGPRKQQQHRGVKPRVQGKRTATSNA